MERDVRGLPLSNSARLSMTTVLPRPVARWLQNLDLTYSIKNPTRDFSNGFLIAEILERYFGSEVPIHGFNPGNSLKVKQDNWEQLSHILIRKNININQHDVVNCVRQHHGAAVSLVSYLFRVLEKPSLPEPVVPSSTTDDQAVRRNSPPNYTKMTAAFRVKDSSIERTVDDMERKWKRVQVIYDLRANSRVKPSTGIQIPIRPRVHIISEDRINKHDSVIPTEVDSIEALLVET